MVVDAVVSTHLDSGVIHFDFGIALPLRLTAVDASPSADAGFRSSDVTQTFCEVVDLVSPLHECHGVESTVVGELGVLSLVRREVAVGIISGGDGTPDVAFFDIEGLIDSTLCLGSVSNLDGLIGQCLHISGNVRQIVSGDAGVVDCH